MGEVYQKVAALLEFDLSELSVENIRIKGILGLSRFTGLSRFIFFLQIPDGLFQIIQLAARQNGWRGGGFGGFRKAGIAVSLFHDLG